MIGLLGGAKFGKGLFRCLVEIVQRRADRVAELAARETAVIRGRGKQQNHFVGLFDDEFVRVGFHGAAFRQHAQSPGVTHTLSAATVIERSGHQQLVIIHRDDLSALFAIQGNFERQRTRTIGGQPRHEHLIRRADEMRPPEAHAVFLIRNFPGGSDKIEDARVVLRIGNGCCRFRRNAINRDFRHLKVRDARVGHEGEPEEAGGGRVGNFIGSGFVPFRENRLVLVLVEQRPYFAVC